MTNEEVELGVLVDDTTAICDPLVFDRLPEYSCSLPTGTRIRKRWKRREPYSRNPSRWYLGEYVKVPDEGLVGIVWRDLLGVT